MLWTGAGPTSTETRAIGNAAADAGAVEPTQVTAQVLDWFDPPRESANWDVVLAADTVWLEELVPPFVNTLTALCPPGSGRTVIMSYQRRGKTADEHW